MPSGQPFTLLCQSLSAIRKECRVDLHVHTTCSDGLYSPAQVVELARRCGMPAVAITDHDTLAAIEPARQSAPAGFEVIAGVEVTAEFQEREIHLLAYFVETGKSALSRALDELRQSRQQRFWVMVDRLRDQGVNLEIPNRATLEAGTTLGRRHLAELLVQSRKAANVRQAFVRYLGDFGRICEPKKRLPAEQALALIRQAGGVASWAHPSYDAPWEKLVALARLGLGAIEVDFPACKAGRQRELREWAGKLDLAVTGGSDCHGPDQPARGFGCCGTTWEELNRLRERRP